MLTGNFNILNKFVDKKRVGNKNIIIYIMAGYPNLKKTEELIIEMSKNGINIIEIGIPFSDPIADGPTIQKAGYEALKNNVSLRSVLGMVKRIRNKVDSALIIMSYYNPILKYGLKKFLNSCKNSGIDGIIIPDLVPEESKELLFYAKKNNVSVIFLLAPNSKDTRIRYISKLSSSFIYSVSLTGVTGARKRLPKLKEYIKKVKSFTDKPVAVGFGISKKEQVSELLKYADGVIIGSAIINIIRNSIDSKNMVQKVIKFIKNLKKGR